MGFLLSIIALILFSIVYVLDEMICLFVDVRKRKWYRITSKRKFTKAFKVDVFANYLFPNTWNIIFSTGGYAFGRFGETLSSCLGRKAQEDSLSWFGWFFYYVLYALDYSKWKYDGHCIASIMSDYQINDFLNRE